MPVRRTPSLRSPAPGVTHVPDARLGLRIERKLVMNDLLEKATAVMAADYEFAREKMREACAVLRSQEAKLEAVRDVNKRVAAGSADAAIAKLAEVEAPTP